MYTDWVVVTLLGPDCDVGVGGWGVLQFIQQAEAALRESGCPEKDVFDFPLGTGSPSGPRMKV